MKILSCVHVTVILSSRRLKICIDDPPPSQVSTDAAQKFSVPRHDSRLQSEHAVSPPCCEYWSMLIVLNEGILNYSVICLSHKVVNIVLLCYHHVQCMLLWC